MTPHSWLNPKCQVRKIACGHGVFAEENIQRDDIIAIFGGHIMHIQDEPVFSDGRGDYALQITEDFVLGPSSHDEIEAADFFNHSCDPNAGFRGQIVLVAMRNIAANEQVTFDYAMCLDSSAGMKYEFQCTCGSAECRKTITNSDWRIPRLQERYGGYFQWYLQEKCNKIAQDL